ncbi:MAG: autotransporter outer membrane beta-barrel domain-containing protein [Proteobacteria bacterium]|nr:autotransporter outer membrane beta-barrel domain-containing protein [Pseudomonadota bacterium]
MAAPAPVYQGETALFAALPAQVRQGDLAMIGNLHRRVGDQGAQRNFWARAIYTDLDIRQSGGAAPASQGSASGLQVGSDFLVMGNWRFGAFVGALDGSVDVSGNANGAFGRVGYNQLRSTYVGGYATWIDAASGWYADAVLQGGHHSYDVRPDKAASASGNASSFSASIEGGKSFALNSTWSIEPQAQLVYQGTNPGDVQLAGARVQQDASNGWIGRIGLRIKGDMPTSAGRLQPYARVNVYRADSGTDVVSFVSNGATVAQNSSGHGYTSTELAGGFTLSLTPATSLYGEVGHLFSNSGDTQVKSSVQGSLGVRVSW